MSISSDVAINRFSTDRSDLEIDQDISPLMENIQATVQQRLRWRNIIIPYSKKFLWDVIKEPAKAILKTGFCAATAYIIYLLTRGTFAGIEVDEDSNFSNVFSSDKAVRLNGGLNLTNGDQAGQFIIDAVALGYVAFKLVFHDVYNKLAGEIINDCYKTPLIELLNSMHKDIREGDIEGNASQPYYKLKEEVDRIYKRLKEDLNHYGEQPIFYKKIIFIPPPAIETENFELSSR